MGAGGGASLEAGEPLEEVAWVVAGEEASGQWLITHEDGLAGLDDDTRHSKSVMMVVASLSLSIKLPTAGQGGSPIPTPRGHTPTPPPQTTGRQEAGSVSIQLGLPLPPNVGGRHEDPSDVWSAGVWGEYSDPRLPVPHVCVVLCALAHSVRVYPRLGVLALSWHPEPSATFPLSSMI